MCTTHTHAYTLKNKTKQNRRLSRWGAAGLGSSVAAAATQVTAAAQIQSLAQELPYAVSEAGGKKKKKKKTENKHW